MDTVLYASPTICVVDDSEDDLLVLKRALKRLEVVNPLLHFFFADDALRFFNSSQSKSENIGLVLLDINLPGCDGVSFLKAFRADKKNNRIPVVMFTTSDSPLDIASSYEAGANAFVRKPVAAADFSETLENIVNFWLKTARMPSINAEEF